MIDRMVSSERKVLLILRLQTRQRQTPSADRRRRDMGRGSPYFRVTLVPMPVLSFSFLIACLLSSSFTLFSYSDESRLFHITRITSAWRPHSGPATPTVSLPRYPCCCTSPLRWVRASSHPSSFGSSKTSISIAPPETLLSATRILLGVASVLCRKPSRCKPTSLCCALATRTGSSSTMGTEISLI